jgi:hypothetical protein
MKNVAGILLFLLVLGSLSCDNGEEIAATDPPGVVFSSGGNPFQDDNIIHAAVGERFILYADLSDGVGLRSFNLFYPDWYLDNTIDLTAYYPDETLLEYGMSFGFEVPDDVEQDGEFLLQLTVTNLGGLSTEKEIVVRLDGDYNPPDISEVEPVNNAVVSPTGLRIAFRVQEDRELQYVVFRFPQTAVYDSITSFRGGKAFSYDEPFGELSAGKYTYTIKAMDMFDNAREKSVDFIISE